MKTERKQIEQIKMVDGVSIEMSAEEYKALLCMLSELTLNTAHLSLLASDHYNIGDLFSPCTVKSIIKTVLDNIWESRDKDLIPACV